jgi:hypothetical protein
MFTLRTRHLFLLGACLLTAACQPDKKPAGTERQAPALADSINLDSLAAP